MPGHGVVGILESDGLDTLISLGSPLLMEERGLRLGPVLELAVEQARARGLSHGTRGMGRRRCAVFSCLPSSGGRASTRCIAWLRAAGLDVGILTGDHVERGRAIARELGVTVEAGLLPEQKVDGHPARPARARPGRDGGRRHQ